jgi:rubredoxin
VLGLRFFTCEDCETVYADVDEPPRCGRCDGVSFEELDVGTQAADYFAGR